MTPLHIAVIHNNAEIVKLLLEQKNIDKNIKDSVKNSISNNIHFLVLMVSFYTFENCRLIMQTTQFLYYFD